VLGLTRVGYPVSSSRETGLVHSADSSRTNLAVALGLLSRWRLPNLLPALLKAFWSSKSKLGANCAPETQVRSTDGDTLPDLAPKARSLVDGMEGEVARTNRKWRRMLAKQPTSSDVVMNQ
jgi:hypothetical protein